VTIITPIREIIAGSSQNLTCNVELIPAVDVPVVVSVLWTGQAGFTTTNTARPIMDSTTNYTVSTLVDAVRNGNYTCEASISPSVFITSDGAIVETFTLSVGKTIIIYYHRFCYQLRSPRDDQNIL
jgi:hypothetical protein